MSYENDYMSVYDQNDNETMTDQIQHHEYFDDTNQKNNQINKKLYKKKNKFNLSVLLFLFGLVILLYFLIKENCKKSLDEHLTIDHIIKSEPLFNLR
jgi:hypothetical protein